MEENVTSSEPLQPEEKPQELTEMFAARKKTATFLDTLTVQAILCVLLAIAFVVVNIVNGGLAADILDAYKDALGSDGDVTDVIAAIINFLGTAPIDNV